MRIWILFVIPILLIPHALGVQWNIDNYEVRTGQANFVMGRQYTFSTLKLVSNGIAVDHEKGSFLFNVSSDSGIPTVTITDFWNDNIVGFDISALNGVISTLVFNRTLGIKEVLLNDDPMSEYTAAVEIISPGWARDNNVITVLVSHSTGDRVVKLDFDPFNPPAPGGGAPAPGFPPFILPPIPPLPPLEDIIPAITLPNLGQGLIVFGNDIRTSVLYFAIAIVVIALIFAWMQSSKNDRDDARSEWEYHR